MARVIVLFAALMIGGCATTTGNLQATSPEAKVAIYADRVLQAVELTQQGLIQYGDADPAARESLTPAVLVTIKMGELGRTLAHALRSVDQATTDDGRITAVVQARDLLLSIQTLLLSIAASVPEQQPRQFVVQQIERSQVLPATMRAWQAITPLLPRPTP